MAVAKSDYSLENIRFNANHPAQEHIQTHYNEDRVIADGDIGNGWQLFGVLDGHDGNEAVDFVKETLVKLLRETKDNIDKDSIIKCFLNTDESFFESKKRFIKEREAICQKLEVGLLPL